MALVENTLLGKVNKVEIAIERFKIMEPEEGYWLATSCGKDSGAIERLAQMAGVKYEAHYSLTSVDPPELVRFAQSKEKKKEIIIDQPRYEDGSPMTMRKTAEWLSCVIGQERPLSIQLSTGRIQMFGSFTKPKISLIAKSMER